MNATEASEARVWIARANLHFEQGEYPECARMIAEAITIAESEKEWVLCSALLCRLAMCHCTEDNYKEANICFRRALDILQRDPAADEAMKAVIKREIAQSSMDEMNKDETRRLKERLHDLCAANDFDTADTECANEEYRASEYVAPRDWYMGILKSLKAMCRDARLRNRLFDESTSFKDSEEEIRALMAEVKQLLADSRTHAIEGGVRVLWMMDFLDRVDIRVRSTEKLIAEVAQRVSAGLSGISGIVIPQPTAETEEPDNGTPTWLEPFTGVHLTLDGPAGRILDDIDQLYRRSEFRLCLTSVREAIRKAEKRQEWLFGAIVLVTGARCRTEVGNYEGALDFYDLALAWLKRSNQAPSRIAEVATELREYTEQQKGLAEEIEPVSQKCATLCQHTLFDEAVEDCARFLREQPLTDWQQGLVKVTQAVCRIRKLRASTERQAADAVAVEALLVEAEALFSEHRVFWVQNRVAEAREALEGISSN